MLKSARPATLRRRHIEAADMAMSFAEDALAMILRFALARSLPPLAAEFADAAAMLPMPLRRHMPVYRLLMRPSRC